MPYIKSDDGRREALKKGDIAKSAGELNFQIFYFVKNYDWRLLQCEYYGEDFGNSNFFNTIISFVDNFLRPNPNYQRYNDMTGCLIRCAREIKRRLNIDVEDIFMVILNFYDDEINKYEDKKIIENGDV